MKQPINWKRPFLILLLLLPACHTLLGADIEADFQGEVAGWLLVQDGEQTAYELGIRYLPGLKLSASISSEWKWDAELVANIQGQVNWTEETESEAEHIEKVYRLWARLYTDQAGVRLGRQEISFGPAKMLRSLRWFDQKDSRDPTGFSEGVNALLLRYYFQNNANIWLWSLYGNEDSVGLSYLPTSADTFESGGRVEIPSGSAEIGLSLHYRQIDSDGASPQTDNHANRISEKRIGFDLSWDLNVGVYLETTLLQLEENNYYPERQLFVTVGSDYTFDIGDGLGTIFEVMRVETDAGNLGKEYETTWIEALSVQYSLNLLDQLQMLLFHTQYHDITTLQAQWRRTYDNLALTAILFGSDCPEDESSTVSQGFSLLDTSCRNGIRLLIQYNH